MSELIPTKASDMKRTTTEVHKCSSGFIYRVSRMEIVDYAKLLDKFDFTKMGEITKDPAQLKELLFEADRIVPKYIMEPKVTSEMTEDSITKEMIPIPDILELFGVIVALGGFTQEAIDRIQSFQKNINGEIGKENSREIQPKA